MLAAYRVDVADPAVTARRIHLLAERLPPPARQGGESWSVEAHLLALLVDHVAQLTWVTVRANGGKNAPRPKPLPRPDRHPRPAAAAPAAGGAEPGGPRKARSWTDAAAQLAGLPGVTTDG